MPCHKLHDSILYQRLNTLNDLTIAVLGFDKIALYLLKILVFKA